jgi:hypothetical protein
MNSTIARCSIDSVALKRITSSISCFSWGEPTFGGGPGRNMSERSMIRGRTRYQCGVRKPGANVPPFPSEKGIGCQRSGSLISAPGLTGV